jgi:hypothetical protein
MRASPLCLLALFSSAAGCKSEAGVSTQWSRIVEGSWSLQAGDEDPRWCQKVTVTEDTFISAIRPVHPIGTHHTTLSLRDDPDGTATCAGSNLGPDIIYAAGVGSGELKLPAGVAMKLKKGQALFFGLHIYNASQQPLSGTSALEVVKVPPSEVTHEADMFIAGPLGFTLGAGVSTVSNECTVRAEQTAFAIFPHMHQLGRHLKTTATASGTPVVLHDGDYRFEEQVQLPIAPITLREGDTISTECTYDNDTGKPVTFGESSDTEMCFTILYRYPASGVRFCGSGGGSGGNPDGGTSTPCAKPGRQRVLRRGLALPRRLRQHRLRQLLHQALQRRHRMRRRRQMPRQHTKSLHPRRLYLEARGGRYTGNQLSICNPAISARPFGEAGQGLRSYEGFTSTACPACPSG